MNILRIAAVGVSLALAVTSVATSLGAATRENGSLTVPSAYHMAMLVHSAVAALDQANRTGNYQVLRSLAAPAFQRANNPERLAQIFARLRDSPVRLAPTILYDPLLKKPAWIDPEGHLRLIGYFPTTPMRIHFDLRFAPVEEEWRLFGISIRPRPVRQARAG